MSHPNDRFNFRLYALENRITKKVIQLPFYVEHAPTQVSDDYRCVHCWEPVPEGEVPLLMWGNDGHDMAIVHFECAKGLGLFSALG